MGHAIQYTIGIKIEQGPTPIMEGSSLRKLQMLQCHLPGACHATQLKLPAYPTL